MSAVNMVNLFEHQTAGSAADFCGEFAAYIFYMYKSVCVQLASRSHHTQFIGSTPFNKNIRCASAEFTFSIE